MQSNPVTSIGAFMARITHLVATGPIGMSSADRKFLDDHTKIVQGAAREMDKAMADEAYVPRSHEAEAFILDTATANVAENQSLADVFAATATDIEVTPAAEATADAPEVAPDAAEDTSSIEQSEVSEATTEAASDASAAKATAKTTSKAQG